MITIFRQFGFELQNTAYNSGGATIYYHCFLKICSTSAEATCSQTTVRLYKNSYTYELSRLRDQLQLVALLNMFHRVQVVSDVPTIVVP